MKKYILIFSLLVSFIASSQKTLNDYKYVIVPIKYDFLEGENRYRLNTITKHNLTKIGMVPFYENENLPIEIAADRCSRLYVNVETMNSLLVTKLVVVFRDCENNIVYKSEVGTSKEKEYKTAYPVALEGAFASVFNYGYSYNGTVHSTKIVSTPVSEKVIETPKSSQEPEESAGMLFAQAIPNGYQLIDKTPKIVLKIFKTSQPDYFTAQSETINGAVIRKNGEWILEYYKDDKPVSEKLLIKF